MRAKARGLRRAFRLGLAALIGCTGLTILGPAAPIVHADPPCMANGGIYVVFVRGSGENIYDVRAKAFHDTLLGNGSAYGAINPPPFLINTAWVEIGNLNGAVPSDGLHKPDPGNYPAVGYADWGLPLNMDNYYSSVWTGTAELTKHLNDRASRCPHESIVIGGYSQGAEVVGYALQGVSDYTLSHIGYVALYGDPRSSACNQFVRGIPWSRGNANCALGVLGWRIPYVPNSLIGRVGSWCDASDGICTGNIAYIQPSPLASHGNAYQNRWIADSGNEIASMARQKLNELNPNSPPVDVPSYSITPPDPSDPPRPTTDNTRIALPSGQQYVWQRGVTLPISYADAQRYDAENNPLSSANTNWSGPTNNVSLPPNTVFRPVGSNQQYLWSSGGQKLPIGDPATSACYLFSFPLSNPTGQLAVVPADWASTLPQGNQGQCSLGDGIRFTQSDTGGQQYISVRGAALLVSYDDAQAYDGEGDRYAPLTMPTGYVSNPIHASGIPANTVLRAAGSTAQFLWDGNQLHAIQNMGTSACLLLAYPQNGVAIVPPSWTAGRAQGGAAQCNLGDGVRFTESSLSGTQQYISMRGAALPVNYNDAMWYNNNGDSTVIDMPSGYVETHAATLPANTVILPTGNTSQYFWDGSQLHYIPDPNTSACLLSHYPQNGAANVPASWAATLPVGANQSCS